MDQHDAVYTMAVAARLSGMHPQTLRKYERAGLLRPARQAGNQRRYSPADIRRLHRIQFFVDERGLNVAGLALILAMIDRQIARAPLEDRDARAWHLVLRALGNDLTPKDLGLELHERRGRRRREVERTRSAARQAPRGESG